MGETHVARYKRAPLDLRIAIADAIRSPGVLQYYQEGGYDYRDGCTDLSIAEEINKQLQPSPPCTQKMVSYVRVKLFGMSRRGDSREQAKAANRANKHPQTPPTGEEMSHRIIAMLNRLEVKVDKLLAVWCQEPADGP